MTTPQQTVVSKATLLYEYPDNTSGAIVPQQLRDFVVSCIGMAAAQSSAPVLPTTIFGGGPTTTNVPSPDQWGYVWTKNDGTNTNLWYVNDTSQTIQLTSGGCLGGSQSLQCNAITATGSVTIGGSAAIAGNVAVMGNESLDYTFAPTGKAFGQQTVTLTGTNGFAGGSLFSGTGHFVLACAAQVLGGYGSYWARGFVAGKDGGDAIQALFLGQGGIDAGNQFTLAYSTATTPTQIAGGTVATPAWDGLWHVLAAAYDGSHLYWYLDGTQIGAAITISTLTVGTTNFNIGYDTLNGTLNIQGSVGDVIVLNAIPGGSVTSGSFTGFLSSLTNRWSGNGDNLASVMSGLGSAVTAWFDPNTNVSVSGGNVTSWQIRSGTAGSYSVTPSGSITSNTCNVSIAPQNANTMLPLWSVIVNGNQTMGITTSYNYGSGSGSIQYQLPDGNHYCQMVAFGGWYWYSTDPFFLDSQDTLRLQSQSYGSVQFGGIIVDNNTGYASIDTNSRVLSDAYSNPALEWDGTNSFGGSGTLWWNSTTYTWNASMLPTSPTGTAGDLYVTNIGGIQVLALS